MNRHVFDCGQQRSTAGSDVGPGTFHAHIEPVSSPTVAARRTDAAAATEGAHR